VRGGAVGLQPLTVPAANNKTKPYEGCREAQNVNFKPYPYTFTVILCQNRKIIHYTYTFLRRQRYLTILVYVSSTGTIRPRSIFISVFITVQHHSFVYAGDGKWALFNARLGRFLVKTLQIQIPLDSAFLYRLNRSVSFQRNFPCSV